jgi:hypothetical protein
VTSRDLGRGTLRFARPMVLTPGIFPSLAALLLYSVDARTFTTTSRQPGSKAEEADIPCGR